MQYQLSSGIWNSVFAVPTAVVDRHLKLTGSVQLKALLWVLRRQGTAFTDTQLAEALGCSPVDARDALSYWQETGILSFHTAEAITKPTQKPVPSPSAQEPMQPQVQAAAPVRHAPLPRAERPDAAFTVKRMETDDTVRCMMQDAEQILCRPLSPSDMSTLLLIHDNYGLPADVLLMLVQYAQSGGKGNMRYIEKVALNWADEGITTHLQAEEKLQQLTDMGRAWRTVQKAAGLPERAPTEREKTYAVCWVLQWKFSPAMLKLAYDRCVDATGVFKANYINKILERWHREGILTCEQAQAEKKQRQETRKEASRPSFDLDAYERDSLYDTLGGNR